MQTTKITIEYDTTKTHSGLPAPEGWYIAERREDGLMWVRPTGSPISVIEDITTKADGKRWLHVSLARQGKHKNSLPTYEEINLVRHLFIGDHRECYHVFPPKDRWVNFANVLHLWACLDEPDGVLPHFEGMIDVVNLETGKREERISI